MSSVLIRQGLPQPERLATLNDIAITQMRVMLAANNVGSLKLNPANAWKMLDGSHENLHIATMTTHLTEEATVNHLLTVNQLNRKEPAA